MHLTIRVAWHDNRWNGTVCRAPSANAFCLALERIRNAPRDDAKENQLANTPWGQLRFDDLPPCAAESGAFMTPTEWRRQVKHPYQLLPGTAATHGHLKPTVVTVPPYSTFAVPFWWMLRKNQEAIDTARPEQLPPDEEPPFTTPWVFGRARQEALGRLFFDHLTADRSLVFFYTKEGHPLGDDITRLIVGVGQIETIGSLLYYESTVAGKPTYPLWDRIIRHSIRPKGESGFLLPYHDYLEPTGDPEEDLRRMGLAREIAVVPDSAQLRVFSYMAELANADSALSALVQALEAVRRIKQHGIASGPWDAREEWLNGQIGATWKERGAFPGLGAALEAIGLRLGTALALDLFATDQVRLGDDPWPVMDAILRAQHPAPKSAYRGDIAAASKTWIALSDERRALLTLLSRFDLTPRQVARWFDSAKRPIALTDAELLRNPYRIPEVDLGDATDGPISISVTDRGLLPDATIAAQHPVPEPSAVASWLDPRRLRAALISVLKAAATNGDALLAEREALSRLAALGLPQSEALTADWLEANMDFLAEAVSRYDARLSGQVEQVISVLQLQDLRNREQRLAKILRARAAKALPTTGADWKTLVIQAIAARGGSYNPEITRHVEALEEQAAALEKITTRKLSVLVGKAGTGKTSTLGALLLCERIANDGILLLAPTGKARVLLGKAANAEAMTVAQFLYHLGRYDTEHQFPLFTGKEKYHKERTVVIDECSMLTLDDLYAVLEALDQVHVQRIILVGDPNQLPPIGVGRPFADLVGNLELAVQSQVPEEQILSQALGKLQVEVRSAAGGPSDTLHLASWFTREPQPADSDRVFDALARGEPFNDLEIRYWTTPEELHTVLLEAFQEHLALASPEDIVGFDRALGLTEERWVPFDNPKGAENFQILSPVRMHAYGIYELNRFIQRHFRGPELDRARRSAQYIKLGDEEIVIRDKVIQVINQRRSAYDRSAHKSEQLYLANGEVGICGVETKGFLNVVFAERPGYTVGYSWRDFSEGGAPLELAYALTIHKAQGSEFKKVFVILPRQCRLLSRELLYTALTRSRDKLVLLIEGSDSSILYDYTRPERSETVRRNTNLFQPTVRTVPDEVPYAEHLIHRTLKGHMVRSKSELVIANMLYQMGVEYQYEPKFEGTLNPGLRYPDFMFVDPAGDPIIWEHLGMLARQDYRDSWEDKRKWYLKNGLIEGENLFTTQDDLQGGLDSAEVSRVIEQIQVRL